MNLYRTRSSASLVISLLFHALLGLAWSLLLWNELPKADDSAILVDWVLTANPRPTPRVETPRLRDIERSFDRAPVIRQMNTAFVQRQLTPRALERKDLPQMRTQFQIPLQAIAPLDGSGGELGDVSLDGRGSIGDVLGAGGNGANGAGSGRPLPNSRPNPTRAARSSFTLGDSSEVKTDAPSPVVKNPLLRIADNLAGRPRETNKIDIVFLLDASQSMQDNIYAVETHLEKMVARLFASGLDYRVGVVTFRHTTLAAVMGNDLKVTQPTQDIKSLRKTLAKVKCEGGEKALDAIMETVKEIKFRGDAARHFVLITDEYVEGSFTAREVLGALYRAKIQMDVIGKDEPFQRLAAAETGGVWISIDNLEG